MKGELTTALVLGYPNPEKLSILDMNTSDVVVGVIPFQVQKEDE